MPSPRADLILTNARVRAIGAEGAGSSGPWQAIPTLVAIGGGRILHVGHAGDLENLRGPSTSVMDCEGKALLPGFIDAHLHLFAYAANLLAVDCSPRAVSCIEELLAAVRRRAAETPQGAWVRAWGFEEFYLKERRAPTRWELDQAAPAHPVKLVHRSGHASVLNSAAMALLGVTENTPEPRGALMQRELATGRLTGYCLEMEGELEARGAPGVTPSDLEAAVALAGQRLLSSGITSMHEATPSRALEHRDLLAGLKAAGRFPIRVSKMVSPADLEELGRRGLAFRAGDDGLRIGAVKVMLNETGGQVLPSRQELRSTAARAHLAGFQLAFHAVEQRGIEAAADAIEHALGERPRADHRHRIEHCGVCPPDLARRLARLGVVVVTQPAFIAESGERYLAQVPPAQQRWLYPIATLRSAGLRVAIGSDCPVAPPDPFTGLHGAVTRLARRWGGRVAPLRVGAAEAVSLADALAMYTAEAAFASFDEDSRGRTAPGMLADLALLSHDPFAVEPEGLQEVRVERTFVNGEVVWER